MASLRIRFPPLTVPPATAPKNVFIKVGGTSRQAIVFIKVAGTWRQAIAWVKVDGAWK